jgi:hypothetical protein
MVVRSTAMRRQHSARVFEGSEALVEAFELPGFQRTGTGNVGFLFQQGCRQLGAAEYFARIGFEFPQIEHLRLAVFRIVIAGVAGKYRLVVAIPEQGLLRENGSTRF